MHRKYEKEFLYEKLLTFSIVLTYPAEKYLYLLSFLFSPFIYLDIIGNLEYLTGVEIALVSIGKSIADALKKVFTSDGIENKDVCNMMLKLVFLMIFPFVNKGHRTMWTYAYTTRNI